MKPTFRARALPRRALLGQAVPFLGGLWLAWWAMERAAEAGLSGLLPGLGEIAPWQWSVALFCTAVSYLAIGRHERALHGWLATGVAPGAGASAGRAAVALSQMTGLGLVTGTLVRWILLSDLGLARAAVVTAAVGASFLGALAVIAAAAVVVADLSLPAVRLAAWGVLGLALIAALAIVALPARPATRRLPPLPRLGLVLGLVALDLVAAAIGFAALFGTFDPRVAAAAIVGLAAGLVAATPAGLGGFDAALATLLPAADADRLMVAALAFRLVYFALPGVLGAAAVLLRPAVLRGGAPAPSVAIRDGLSVLAQAARARRAESALAAHPGNDALVDAQGTFLACLRRGRSTLVAFAPPDGHLPLLPLRRAAEAEGRAALAYKIGGADAARARRQGWAVRLCGSEASLRPGAFSREGPARRQLRRKLRHAAGAGIVVARVRGPLPWAALERIDADWRRDHGAARGTSMGRLCHTATARQVVHVACLHGQPVAFASFHATPREWALDLMRGGPGLPDGTMHALIAAAIRDAAAEGVPRLSLAAVPRQRLPGPLQPLFDRWTGAGGLRQFKASFAPSWSPLYAAAPSWPGLALGLADIAREIVSED